MTSNNAEYRATEQGFFAAIEEDPHELANWLVFADFLEDHGHPAAEVTRLWAAQRFASTPPSEMERIDLEVLLTSGLRPYLPRCINSIGMELVLVPWGTFWMGDGYDNAARQVEVPYGFYMGVYQVTQEQWQIIMGNNPSHFSRGGEGMNRVERVSDADLKQFPVESVSWEDIQQFLKKLNEKEKPGGGWMYRLPTEAEWEYSCRGAATSREECSFDFYLATPTDDLSSRQANFDGNSPAGNAPKGRYLIRPTRVGSYPPNSLGLFDMHGNVWELCDDWYTEGASRMLRGGSWDMDAEYCRAAWRDRYSPDELSNFVGFRLVLVPPGR